MACKENNESISEEQEEEEIEEDDQESEEEDEETEEDVNGDDVALNQCKHAVENSSRFSLRVMEAMRFLQSHDNVLPISSVKEIVDYIAKNYNNDGDLYAQVRTALKQLCTQGFVEEALKDEYQLIGPFGSMYNCNVDRSNSEISSSTPKCTQLRKTFNKKCKKRLQCLCEELEDELELGVKRKESTTFSGKNNTLLVTPKHRLLRSTLKDNNSRMRSATENAPKRKSKACNVRENNDSDKFCECTPKRTRKKNDDNLEALTPTDQINGNSHDSIFQEIKNLTPNTSKTRDRELKKWIQRCRRECERQKNH